ncbi:MAG: phosphotransferase [Rhodospirillales bacterium]|nr:phosphotransferase [Rhodospirillales bacterium]
MSGEAGPAAAGADAARDSAIRDLLADAGFTGAGFDYLAGDASFRRYARVRGGPRPALIMDAPPGREDVGPWLRMARHLRGLGLSAPEIYAADEPAGLLLIEDFGDETFTRVLAAGGDEGALYDLAVDVLAAIHARPASDTVPLWLPPYDEEKLLAEAALFTDWYLPAINRRPTPDALRDDYLALFKAALAPARALPATLVLRDYHVDNLMRLAGRDGLKACGLLDFQDAVAGAAAYDLISLIEDARRDLGPGIAERALARYHARFPDLDRDAFAAAGAALAACRNAKIIGIFTRLLRRDGKPGYLAHIPRVWRLLEGDLAHPSLGDLKAWFDDAVPPAGRLIPGPEGAEP